LTPPVQVTLLTSPFLYRATIEEEERILLTFKIFDKIQEERGLDAATEELNAALDFYSSLYVCISFYYFIIYDVKL
jgi:hypothetical protein